MSPHRHSFANIAAIALLIATGAGSARACVRADFEAVVGEAAAGLRDLNQQNRPEFQNKLRALRGKRGWDHPRFLIEAAPLVQDEAITGFDDRSTAFLAKIEQLGAAGSQAATPDCARLAEVRDLMRQLVEVQRDKWRYMFEKLERELAQ